MLGVLSTLHAKGHADTLVLEVPPTDPYLAIIDATNTASSLVAHWRFNGSLNERIAGRHATLGAGSESYTAGLPDAPGNAFNCAAANWLQVTHNAALKPAVGSLMVWFEPASVHNATVAACNAAGVQDDHFDLRVGDGGIISCFFQISSVTTTVATSAPYYIAAQTVHAIVTWNSSGIDLYLDANHIGHAAGHTTGLTNNTLDWLFGTFEGDTTIFNGVIDEIAIWNRVLTRNEIYLLAQTEPD